MGSGLVDLPEAVGHPAFPATLEGLVTRSRGSVMEAARAALDDPDSVEEAWVAPTPRVLAPLSLSEPGRGRLVAPESTVSWPEGVPCRWEPEIACVTGSGGSDLDPEAARSLIFGFVLASTWTGPGQDPELATATALGPCLVTVEGFDLTEVTLTTRVNRGVWARERIGDAVSRFAETIARTSAEREVLPGEVFSCPPFDAPVPGGGRRDLSRDATVEIEAGELGVLRNRVRFRRRAGRTAQSTRPIPRAQDVA